MVCFDLCHFLPSLEDRVVGLSMVSGPKSEAKLIVGRKPAAAFLISCLLDATDFIADLTWGWLLVSVDSICSMVWAWVRELTNDEVQLKTVATMLQTLSFCLSTFKLITFHALV